MSLNKKYSFKKQPRESEEMAQWIRAHGGCIFFHFNLIFICTGVLSACMCSMGMQRPERAIDPQGLTVEQPCGNWESNLVL